MYLHTSLLRSGFALSAGPSLGCAWNPDRHKRVPLSILQQPTKGKKDWDEIKSDKCILKRGYAMHKTHTETSFRSPRKNAGSAYAFSGVHRLSGAGEIQEKFFSDQPWCRIPEHWLPQLGSDGPASIFTEWSQICLTQGISLQVTTQALEHASTMACEPRVYLPNNSELYCANLLNETKPDA